MSAQRSGRRRILAITFVTGAVLTGLAVNAAPSFAAGAPTVTSLSVTKGSTAGGTNVLITGTGFSSVDEGTLANVKWGANAASAIMVLSDTQIAAKAPSGTGADNTGLVDVTVTNPNGTSTASTGSKFAYRAPLTAALAGNVLLNPVSGSTLTVPVTGYTFGTSGNFALEKVTATVNGTAAVVTYGSSSTVKLAIPAGTPSNTAVPIALFHDTVAGTNDTTHAKYAAVITALSVTKGPKEGTTGANLTITGKGLTGATTFLFGAEAATCTVTNDTTATCADIPASDGTTPVVGAVSVSFTPANSVPYGTTTGAAYTYTDVS